MPFMGVYIKIYYTILYMYITYCKIEACCFCLVAKQNIASNPRCTGFPEPRYTQDMQPRTNAAGLGSQPESLVIFCCHELFKNMLGKRSRGLFFCAVEEDCHLHTLHQMCEPTFTHTSKEPADRICSVKPSTDSS